MKYFRCCIASLLVCFKTFSQQDLPKENIYLHLNQSSCFPGDTIFFKSYAITENQLSLISSTLYVDVFTSKGERISEQVFPLYQGIGLGQIIIPYAAKPGIYYLRAYTKYQLNFDSFQLFQVPINVIDTKNNCIEQISLLPNRQGMSSLNIAIITDTFTTNAKGFNSWRLLISDTNVLTLSLAITDADIPASPITIGNRISMMSHATIHSDLLIDSCYLQLKGYARRISKRRPIQHKPLTFIIIATDSVTYFRQTIIDTAGCFDVQNIFFFDSAIVGYQLQDKAYGAKDVKIYLDSFSTPPFHLDSTISLCYFIGDTVKPAFIKVTERKKSLFDYRQVGMMKEVVVTAKKKTLIEKVDEEYASGGYSASGSIFARSFDVLHDPFAAGATLATYLNGKVPNLTVNDERIVHRNGPVLCFLNEMECDFEVIKNIPFSNIAYIVFHPSPFIMGRLMQAGLCVYTKNGNEMEREINNGSGLNKLVMRGYSRMYLPAPMDYSDSSKLNYPDNRVNLYWNPLFNPREYVIRFYNNDYSKRFRIIIEGVGKKGELMRCERIVE